MPQASPESRARIVARFGGIGCEGPVEFLQSRGYRLRDGTFDWVPPKDRPVATPAEVECIDFLVDEWDFGGLVWGVVT